MANAGSLASRPIYEEINRDQLEVLKAKLDVLQGERKAYFETYEQTKRTNEQLLRDLRERQKELQRQVAEAQKRARAATQAAAKGTAIPGGLTVDDARVGDELVKKRTEYDKLRAKTATLSTDLEKLQGQLATIRNMGVSVPNSRRSSAQVGGMDALDEFGSSGGASGGAGGRRGSGGEGGGAGPKDTPLQRKVRQLENRLEKTAIKHEEALSIRRTYEQIVKRLRDERVGYDTQISGLERTIHSKAHDEEELKVLANEATRAMEAAQTELARVRALAAADREKRVKEMREREAMARSRRATVDLALARERARRDLLAEVAGDLGVSEERALIHSVEVAKQQVASVAEQSALIKRKLDAYEQAWRRIRDSTGVTDLADVTTKMAGQVEQHAQLTALSRDNAGRMESLREEIGALRKFVEELRFSGGKGLPPHAAAASAATGGSMGEGALLEQKSGEEGADGAGGSASAAAAAAAVAAGSKALDKFDSALTAATAKYEGAKNRHAELEGRVVETRVGVQHLADKLAVVRGTLGADPLPTVTDETMFEVLDACERTLVGIADRLDKYYAATGTDLLAAASDALAQVSHSHSPGRAGAGAGAPASTSSGAGSERPSSSGGYGGPMSPSPFALARLGLTDDDLVAARTYNTRVIVHGHSHGGGATSRALLPSESVGNVTSQADTEQDGDDEVLSTGEDLTNGDEELAGAGGGGGASAPATREAPALTRDAIKKVAKRKAESLKRTGPAVRAARKEKADGGDGGGGGGGGGAAAAAPASSPSGGGGKIAVPKRAGPPRFTY